MSNDTMLAQLRAEVAAQKAAILAQLPNRNAESTPKGRKGRTESQRINAAEFGQALYALARAVGGENAKENDADLLEALNNAPNVTNSNGMYTGAFVSVSDTGYIFTKSTGKVKAVALKSGDLSVKPEMTETETAYTWADLLA